jgi:hypothetical protein
MLKSATVVSVCPVVCQSTINELTHLMTMHSMQIWVVICFIICDHHTPDFWTDTLACIQFSKATSTPTLAECKTWSFEVLTVTMPKIQVFRDITLCQISISTLQRIIVPRPSVAARPWRRRHNSSKCWELHAQQQSIISQKTLWIVSQMLAVSICAFDSTVLKTQNNGLGSF